MAKNGGDIFVDLTKIDIRSGLSELFNELNYGADPRDEEPDKCHPGTFQNFDPEYTLLLYCRIVVEPKLSFDMLRVHIYHGKGHPELSDVETPLMEAINYLNEPGKFPSRPQNQRQPISTPKKINRDGTLTNIGDYWMGPIDFAMSQQHHVVIYFINDGVNYHDYPVWFNKYTSESNMGYSGPVAENRSFYCAQKHEYPILIKGNCSKFLIHMKNLYQYYDTDYRLIPNTGSAVLRLYYAMNINLMVQSLHGVRLVPVVVDPDTGNMGEGQP